MKYETPEQAAERICATLGQRLAPVLGGQLGPQWPSAPPRSEPATVPAPPIPQKFGQTIEPAHQNYLRRQLAAEQRRKARNNEGVRAVLAERRRKARNPLTADLKGRDWFVACARLGGKARALRLTPERRSEIARLAAQARWSRWTPPPKPERL